MRILIKKGRIIDPVNGRDTQEDILIEQGRIVRVAPDIQPLGDVEIVQAEGCVVAPGLIDMHVHLREPGYEAQEDIESGTLAAVHGGFSAVACMANTDPVVDNAAVVRSILTRASEVGYCRVYPVGSITKDLEGKEISEMGDMVQAGIVAVSDDGKCVKNSAVMRNGLLYAKALGITVISHSEDSDLSSGGSMHEGYYSTVLGLRGIPAAAEEIMVARDCLLAEAVGAKLHLAHISTAGSVRIVREAKARGVRVTCEAAPHHFSLTDRSVVGYDTNTKVNPPLRSEKDVEAVIEGLRDGTIDVIASDHAPHTQESKSVEFDFAPFGISGIETMVPLVVTKLVLPGYLGWNQAIRKLTVGPASVLGLEIEGIKEGSEADLTIIDPNLKKTVDVRSFKSKGHNSPFNGQVLRGWPVATICRGMIVARNEGLVTC